LTHNPLRAPEELSISLNITGWADDEEGQLWPVAVRRSPGSPISRRRNATS